MFNLLYFACFSGQVKALRLLSSFWFYTMDCFAGQLLVASRHLGDPNFSRGVVLIFQHSSQGGLGLVLNRPGDKRISEVWERTGHEPCENPQTIFVGGPVPGPLMALHTVESLSETEILPGLFFSTDKDALDQLVRQQEPFRLFAGHAGWAGGQLEAEMEVGGWLVTPATGEEVWHDPEDIWRLLTQRIGLGIIAPQIDPKQIPTDPSLN